MQLWRGKNPIIFPSGLPSALTIPLQSQGATLTQNQSAYSLNELQPKPYATMRKPPSVDDVKKQLEHERTQHHVLQDQIHYMRLSWQIDHAHLTLDKELSR